MGFNSEFKELNKGMCQSVPHNDVVIEEKVTGA